MLLLGDIALLAQREDHISHLRPPCFCGLLPSLASASSAAVERGTRRIRFVITHVHCCTTETENKRKRKREKDYYLVLDIVDWLKAATFFSDKFYNSSHLVGKEISWEYRKTSSLNGYDIHYETHWRKASWPFISRLLFIRHTALNWMFQLVTK